MTETSPSTPQGITHTDSVLLYNVEPWRSAGYGVPNFGSTTLTENVIVRKMVDQIGVQQLMIMTHVDAGRAKYISRNVIEKIGKLLNYSLNMLSSRGVSASEMRLDENHKTPAAKPWIIHPVPYFQVEGSWVDNPELAELNELFMYSLTNAMQHTDNDLSLEITTDFVADVGQYLKRAMEIVAAMLGVDKATYRTAGFRLATEHYAAYNTDAVPDSEPIKRPRTVGRRPTELDLASLVQGIRSTDIIPNVSVFSDPIAEDNGAPNSQSLNNPDEQSGTNRDPFAPRA